MHSISDLTTTCRRTTGDVPPKLVGASTTVIGSKLYLFGGRLVTERKMVSDMFMFDLETHNWEMLPSHPEDDIPPARYFHSTEPWGNLLVVFGGMGHKPGSPNPEDLIVLNDVRFFDVSTGRWLVPLESDTEEAIPRARYAHLSSITGDRLFVIGGQDINNVWLDDVHCFDLRQKAWIFRREYARHCGTYRSVAVASPLRVRLPHEELRGRPSPLGDPGTRFTSTDSSADPASTSRFTRTESLIHLPYSTAPTDEFPSDIYLYSNYNFTDVKRELEVLSPVSTPQPDFTVSDRSSSMTGSSLPPGLRFPTGAILGNYLILAGTYLAHTYQTYSIWALDLTTNVWHRVEPGTPLLTGSWFRACLWSDADKLVVFGNRHGNLVEDYNRRLLSWEFVATIDLQAFGIYQPPRLTMDVPMQELGLAALEEGAFADFELVCDDGRKVRCSRRLLEERWTWFREQRRQFHGDAARAAETLPTASNVPLPALPLAPLPATADGDTITPVDITRPDPRLTPRSFYLTEPYPITLAFVQYFYTLSLITPVQHAPAVLSQLLVLSSIYNIPHLQRLVVHAMHRALSKSTSVGVYEVATLCSCRSLQIRALKTVMAYNSKRPATRARRRRDSETSDGEGRSGGGGSRGGDRNGGSGGPDIIPAARPRGMSDVDFTPRPPGGNAGNSFQLSQDPLNPISPLAIRKKASPPLRRPLLRATTEGSEQASELLASMSQFTSVLASESRRHTAVIGRPSLQPSTSLSEEQSTDEEKPLPRPPPPYTSTESVDEYSSSGSHTQPLYPAYHLPRPRPTRLDTSDSLLSDASSASQASSYHSTPETPSLTAPSVNSPFSASSGGSFMSMPSTPALAARVGPGPGISRSSSGLSSYIEEGHVSDDTGYAGKAPPRTTSRLGLRAHPSMGSLSSAAKDDSLFSVQGEQGGDMRDRRPNRSISNAGMRPPPGAFAQAWTPQVSAQAASKDVVPGSRQRAGSLSRLLPGRSTAHDRPDRL